MGNRCVITTRENYDNNGVGVYLHWNGGRDSVEGFLKYMELREFRSPKEDESYAWARLCQVVANFFGGTLSIGVDKVSRLDTDGDNGTYIIDGWNIVGRENFDGCEEQDEYTLSDMLLEIDSSQPKSEQLGKEFLSASEIPAEELRVGDEVYVMGFDGRYTTDIVLGHGRQGRILNGQDISLVPYIDKYSGGPDNINNYLLKKSYRGYRSINTEPFETAEDLDLLF